MGTHRAHIVFPEDLAAQILEIAGERGRNAYVVETMRAAVSRQRLLNFVNDMEQTPAWKDEDHPQLARMGTSAYLRKMRTSKSARQKAIARRLASTK
jgi:hypothetical protein